jgi:hypothetical protein
MTEEQSGNDEENQKPADSTKEVAEEMKLPKKVDRKFEKQTAEAKDLIDKAEGKEAEAIEEKIKTLTALENTIDKKSNALKKLIEEAEFHGKSLAGDMVKEDEEERGKRTANEMLKSTGMVPYPDVK